MDDDMAQLVAHELELAHECECTHGVHKDSGHVCLECLINEGDEDAAKP
jgi:hypothetical protein